MSITLKKVRRQVAGFSLAMIIASMFAIGVAQAATFTDVQPSDWFYPYVEDLAAQGILNTSFTSYRPGDLVNRAEMAKLAVEAWNLTLETPTEAPFKDVPLGQWYTSYIYTAQKNNVVGGYKDNEGTLTGYFGPSDPLTREQAMKVISLAAPLTTNTKGGPHFPDVPVSRWSYEYVETGYNWSVVDGYPDGNFKPENQINRAEIAKMVSNALSPVLRPGAGFNVEDAYATSLTAATVCFSGDVGTGADDMANYAITDADGNDLAVSAVELATDPMCVELTTATQTEAKSYDLVVTGVKSAADEDLGIGDISFTGYSVVGTGGDLTCTAGEQPAGISVPMGASGVPFTVVNCSAAADAVVLSGMTFHRFGAGNQGDFSNVYLYMGESRLTSGRTINSETQNVEFSGLNLEIGSNETVSFILAGDIAGPLVAKPASQHGFEVLNADAVSSNASSVDGDFPIKGNLMTISGATAGSISIEANGSLNDLTIGQSGRIAQFQLQASGTEAMDFTRLALYVRGTCASSNVTDLKLYAVGGTEVLAETATVGAKDLATFVLDNPFTLSQGSSQIFYVEAKNTCRNNEKIRTYLDQTTDLYVTGVTYGTGVQVDRAKPVPGNYDGSGVAPFGYSEVLVKGSAFNVAFNGPSSADISIGQKKVSCENLTITNASGADVEIRNWDLTLAIQNAIVPGANGLLDTVAGTNNYSLIKLVKKNADGTYGTSLLGPSELVSTGSDTTQVVNLSGSYTMSAGESVDAAIVFDVANNVAMNGDKVRCSLADLTTAGKDYVRDQNGDALGSESITPASAIVGNIFTVTSSALTLATSNTPSSRSLVRGSTAAEIWGLSITAGSSQDNTITSISLQGYLDNDTVDAGAATFSATSPFGTVTLSNIVDSSVALYDGTTKVSDFQNINATSNTLTFNNLSIKIPKSNTRNLVLKGHISNSAPFAGTNNRVKFAVIANTSVTAIDGSGNNVPSASINVAGAANGLTNAPVAGDVVMTIIPAGQGTTSSSSSASPSAVYGGVASFEVAKWSFTSTNADSVLKDLQLLVLNTSGSSVAKVFLFKGSSCDTATGNVSGYVPAPSGVINVAALDETISQDATLTLCAKVQAGTVNTDGVSQPVEASNIGLGLLNVTQVLSGSGENVAQRYAGSVWGAGMFLATAIDGVCTNLAAGAPPVNCNVANALVLAPVPAIGDVLQIDGEMMRVTAAAASPTVLRGFGNTTPTSHNLGAEVRKSTIATLSTGADVLKGDIVYAPANGYEVCVNPSLAGAVGACDNAADAYALVLGSAGPVFVPAAGNTRFAFHGALSKLFRSVPSVTNLVPAGSAALAPGGSVTVHKFSITANGDEVRFNGNGAAGLATVGGAAPVDVLLQNQLVVKLSASVAIPAAASCSLVKMTGGEQVLATTVTVAGASPAMVPFTFNLNNLSISSGSSNKVDFEVRCDTAAILAAGAVGATLTASIPATNEAIQWGTPVAGSTDLVGYGSLIVPVEQLGYTTQK